MLNLSAEAASRRRTSVIEALRQEFKRCSTSSGYLSTEASTTASSGSDGERDDGGPAPHAPKHRVRSTVAGSALSAELLAERWFALADEDRQAQPSYSPLGAEAEQAIALRVTQSLHDFDLLGRGAVSEEEWVHSMSVLLDDHLAQVITAPLRHSLRTRPRLLNDMLGLFQMADPTGCGYMSAKQVAEMYDRRAIRFAAGPQRGVISEEVLRMRGSDSLARELLEDMDANGDGLVSYGEFVAFCLGRKKSPVYLYMYDLSNGLAQTLSPWVLTPGLTSIWHTGVVAFNREYFFAKDAVWDAPGETDFGSPTKRVLLGHTLWTQGELHGFICGGLKPIFHRGTYDSIGNNCNHFSDKLSLFLTGRRLPEEVLLQSERLLQMAAIRALRPVLNRMLRDHVAARNEAVDDGSAEGSEGAGGEGSRTERPGGPASALAAELQLSQDRALVTRPFERDEKVTPGTLVSFIPAWGGNHGILGVACTPPRGAAPEVAASGAASHAAIATAPSVSAWPPFGLEEEHFEGSLRVNARKGSDFAGPLASCSFSQCASDDIEGCGGIGDMAPLCGGGAALGPFSAATAASVLEGLEGEPVWICWFELEPPTTPAPARGEAAWRGRVRREPVPRSRLLRVEPFQRARTQEAFTRAHAAVSKAAAAAAEYSGRCWKPRAVASSSSAVFGGRKATASWSPASSTSGASHSEGAGPRRGGASGIGRGRLLLCTQEAPRPLSVHGPNDDEASSRPAAVVVTPQQQPLRLQQEVVTGI